MLNGNKIPCIPPLFHRDKHISDFQEKSEIFNSLFDQCSPISNGSVLPSELPLRTDSTSCSYHFPKICICMLKICGDSICRHPLHKKCSIPLRISSVNVTKSAVSCRFGQIY